MILKPVICNGKMTVSPISGIGKTRYSHEKKNESGSLSYTIHKNNSNWIKGVKCMTKTIKLLQENIGITSTDDFLNLTPKAKAKINK